MSGRFGAGAARLSGHAALLLGWTPDTFWTATPEELATILTALRAPDGEAVDRGTIDRLMEQDRGG
ncbi:MAG TPA: phage tail assembly chaperone [Novosphingobium sp.]|nr:phage tail assembly chaperone [Novosphingobium sp.]